MKKYIFFDIDGTLTTPLTAEFPESTKKAIRLLQENGHFVAIATGRIQKDAKEVADALGIHSFVSDGGNGVTIDGNILSSEGLPLSSCFKLLEEIDGENHPWAVAPKNEKYCITPFPHYLEKVTYPYYDVDVQEDFDFHSLKEVRKIFIACTAETQKEILLHGLPMVWFRKDTMLVEPVQKEKGIFEIQKRFDVPDEDIVVFGDGMNDRSMFRKEWTRIAMGNAKEELKALASYVTSRADEDGIYKACKHFNWI